MESKKKSRILILIHNEFSLFNALAIYNDRLLEIHLIIFNDWDIDVDLLSRLRRKVWRLELYNTQKKRSCVENWTSQYSAARRINASIETTRYSTYALVLDKNYCELYLMEKFLKAAERPRFVFIEDGAHSYFNNGVRNGGLGYNQLTDTVRRGIFALLGIRRAYQFNHMEMGANKFLQEFHLHYPRSQRGLYDLNLVKEISKKRFRHVIQDLTWNVNEIKGTILILDHSDVVQDLDRYAEQIKDFVNKQSPVYLKFHPRENEEFIERFRGYTMIKTKLTVERLLATLSSTNIRVFGLTSTALMSAKIFGFDAVSLMTEFRIQNNKAEQFFNNLNIAIK